MPTGPVRGDVWVTLDWQGPLGPSPVRALLGQGPSLCPSPAGPAEAKGDAWRGLIPALFSSQAGRGGSGQRWGPPDAQPFHYQQQLWLGCPWAQWAGPTEQHLADWQAGGPAHQPGRHEGRWLRPNGLTLPPAWPLWPSGAWFQAGKVAGWGLRPRKAERGSGLWFPAVEEPGACVEARLALLTLVIVIKDASWCPSWAVGSPSACVPLISRPPVQCEERGLSPWLQGNQAKAWGRGWTWC